MKKFKNSRLSTDSRKLQTLALKFVFCKFLTKNRTFIQFITDASYSRLNMSKKKKNCTLNKIYFELLRLELRTGCFVLNILTVSVGNVSWAAVRISRPSLLCWLSTKLWYDSLYFSTPKSPFSRIWIVLFESPFSASFGSFLPNSITLDGNLERGKLLLIYRV